MMGEDGAMATGWQHVGNSWYYFDAGGSMHTGWLQAGATWYYLTATGRWPPAGVR